MEPQFTIKTPALNQCDRLIRQLGGEPQIFLHGYQLTPSALGQADLSMLFSDFVRLLNDAAEQFSCPDFGLRLGTMQQVQNLGALGVALQHCTTMREAMLVVRGFMVLHNQAEYWDFHEYADTVVIIRGDLVHHGADGRQANELAMSACYQLGKLLLGHRFRLLRVEFGHSAIAPLSCYQRVFDAEVIFDCPQDQLVLEKGFLEQTLQMSDSRLKQVATDYLQQLHRVSPQDLLQQVMALIQQHLSSKGADIEWVANCLNLHTRTLQRKLQQQGVIFKQLVNEIRMNNACWYLGASQLQLTLVADVLGYADYSNFCRAFTRNKGLSPSAWRKQHQRDLTRR